MFRTAERRKSCGMPREAGGLAGDCPGHTEVLDAFAAALEHEGADRPRLLQRLVLAPEVVHERAERDGEWEHPPGLILRRAGFEARFARLPIDVSCHSSGKTSDWMRQPVT